MRKASLFMLTLVMSALTARANARAPDTFEEAYAKPVEIASPQWFGLEMKLGPFQPHYPAFKETFGSDRGWLLSTELDFTVYHIPYVGQLNAGLGWGWAHYSAPAPIVPGNTNSGEKTEFTIYPLSLLGVLRIDALARYTVVPLTFAGKFGYDFVRWKSKKGSISDGSGVNMGLRWGAQVALELNFLDRKSARRLDEDFGINHISLLFDYFNSQTQSAGGHGLQFGLGLQF